MPNVGDIVTPQLTVTPFDGTTAAALTIIAPDGTSTAGLGEATTDGGNHWSANPVTLSAKDVWCLHWTVTGLGGSTEDQFIMVRAAGTGAQLPAAFASIADAIARLPAGVTLTEAQLQALPGKLADAAVKLRGFCRKRYTALSNDSIAIRPIGNHIKLPQTPVVAVDSVAAITRDGDVPLDGWYWDGIDRIYLGRPWPEPSADWDQTAYSYRVVYDHAAGVHELLVTKNVEIALRHLLSKSPAEGVVNEKIGNYSYMMHQGTGTPGNAIKLSPDDKQELIDAGLRTVAGTSQLTQV